MLSTHKAERRDRDFSVSSYQGTNSIIRFLFSSNSISQRPHPQILIPSHWEVKSSTYEFCDDTNIQCITGEESVGKVRRERDSGNKHMPTSENRQAIYSKLAIARESASITCLLTETQNQSEEW